MIKKFKEIAQAWIIAANPTPEQKSIAERRASICNGCDARTFRTIFGAGDFYVCGECGCPLSRKIFSPEPGPQACPLAKWDR